MIEGVVIKELPTYGDDRGYFRELIRRNDNFFAEGFGQLSHSLMYPGVAKAWHIHKTQVDWWYVPIGNLKVALYDKRENSRTHKERQVLYLGENHPAKILKIPSGVAHGCKALGSQPAHLFYVTSKTYDPDEEGRIAHDDKSMGFDWTAGPEIK